MAEFFDLSGKRAAAAFLQTGNEPAADTAKDGEEKPVPFDGGVALRLLSVEQVAVLDEEQASGNEVGDVLEIGVGALREPGGVDLLFIAVVNPDTRLVLLGVDRKPT